MFAAKNELFTRPSGGYQISRSLRFNRADQAYLERTPPTPGNQDTWTQSLWVKRSSLGTQQDLYSPYYGGNGSDESQAYFNSSDQIAIYDSGASAGYMSFVTTQVFRDVSAWYHIVFACDTTQATASNRLKIYVNGVQITSFATSQTQTQNNDTGWNGTSLQRIGSYARSTNATLDGYMTEFYNIDGQQLTPSSFGETNAQTGVWQPKAYSGSYGTNGFYLNFSDNSNNTAPTLGKDYSGNGNNWTPTGFIVTAGAGNDSLVDSPTSYGTDTGVGGSVRGNYATFNPLVKVDSQPTLSNGNLLSTAPAGWSSAVGTIGLTSGKWYWEIVNGNADAFVGICGDNATLGTVAPQSSTATILYYGNTGNKRIDAVDTAYGSAFSTQTIGVALDIDGGTIVFYRDNVSQGSISLSSSTLNGRTIFPLSGVISTTATVNFGQRAFAYTAPSGYKALCTQNLPTPTIGATSATLATQFFAPVLYTGNGATQTVTVGFQPDWVWYKSRSSAVYNHGLFDSVRGATNQLFSNTTGAEATYSGVTAFNSGGFSVGSDAGGNESGGSMVAWNWRASNATAVTNTSGSITSTVSASTTSGFSIVTYTGTGGTGTTTVGHGLGVSPSMVIIKRRNSTTDWASYHTGLTSTSYYLVLNSTAAQANYGSTFISPSSSTLTIAADSSLLNTSTGTYVAYCFAPVAGYSAFGSFIGNASADGPFIYTGFRPAYVMLKRTDTSGFNWYVYDTKRSTYNLTDLILDPDSSTAEFSSGVSVLDILSNGFKMRGSSGGTNPSSGTMIYAAFAENPFKYSLAR